MAEHAYTFESRWQVLGTPAEVLEILADVESLSRWCPAVYRRSTLLYPGDADHVGAVAELAARGWLGYGLTFRLTITENDDRRCAFTSAGDLVGRGEWRLTPVGQGTLVSFDWRVRLGRPLLRRSPGVLRPVFAANHDWAMAQGERALRLELRRRRSAELPGRSVIPAPPDGGHRRRALGAVGGIGLGLLAVRLLGFRRPPAAPAPPAAGGGTAARGGPDG